MKLNAIPNPQNTSQIHQLTTSPLFPNDQRPPSPDSIRSRPVNLSRPWTSIHCCRRHQGRKISVDFGRRTSVHDDRFTSLATSSFCFASAEFLNYDDFFGF